MDQPCHLETIKRRIELIQAPIYGESDQKALDAFEKALEMVDLKSKLKAVCAAQAGIAASGKDIDILSECQIKP